MNKELLKAEMNPLKIDEEDPLGMLTYEATFGWCQKIAKDGQRAFSKGLKRILKGR